MHEILIFRWSRWKNNVTEGGDQNFKFFKKIPFTGEKYDRRSFVLTALRSFQKSFNVFQEYLVGTGR